MDILEKAYEQAKIVLEKNQTKLGFSATPERHVNYYSVWARDHAITSLGAILTNDEQLIETAQKGIFTLLKAQEYNGQVPTYIEIESKKRVYGGLGSITSIDSNMWVLISAAQIYKRTKNKKFLDTKRINNYRRLYKLLRAFDSNNCGLLESHIAGDWADVFKRTYHVLYDECLYYEFLKSLEFLYTNAITLKTCEPVLLEKIKKSLRHILLRKRNVKKEINRRFWITNHNKAQVAQEYMIQNSLEGTSPFYQSHLEPFELTWEHRFESFGNILAIVTGIADKKKKQSIISHILYNKIDTPQLRILDPPVYEHDADWQKIYATKEQPYVYHNGGSWPFITGFWIYALAKSKKKQLAKRKLKEFAHILENQQWLFNEYFHGMTQEPLGRNNQAWSAAGYIIAYHSIFHNYNVFSY
ncbi:MAG: amylo-alpha-1,6-glucosidase [Candidatus Woesearchaeota archaeon]